MEFWNFSGELNSENVFKKESTLSKTAQNVFIKSNTWEMFYLVCISQHKVQMTQKVQLDPGIDERSKSSSEYLVFICHNIQVKMWWRGAWGG